MTNETPEISPKTPRRRASSDRIQTVTGDAFNPLVLHGDGPIALSSCLMAAHTAERSSQSFSRLQNP